MIDKSSIIKSLEDKISDLPVGHYLDIRTYKRNRMVLIVKTTKNNLLLIEKGFYEQEFEIEINKFRKLMKNLLKKEFPRSTKIRVYTMGEFKGNQPLKRKKI